MEARGGNGRVGPPALTGVEITPVCNDVVWDKSIVFPKPGPSPDLRAAKLAFFYFSFVYLFVLMMVLGCKHDIEEFH